MNLPPIRYARTSDDVSIAYMVLGDGPPIVFASNIFGDVSLYRVLWEHVRGITDGLVARSWRVVRYDNRGMGNSDRDAADLSLEARVRDLDAVVESLGAERFVLAGVDLGAPTAIAYAARQPARVSKIVLLSPWLRGAERFAIPGARVAAAINPTVDQDWPFASKAISSISTEFEGWKSERVKELAEAIQQSTSPRSLAAHRQESLEIDVTECLPQLTMPALVTHDPYFAFGSLELCRGVAAGLPDATFVTVEENSIAGDTHVRHVDFIDEFLRSGRVSHGRKLVPDSATSPARGIHLTSREAEVLGLLADGLSNKEIAIRLTLAVSTVERHLVNAYGKIGARGRADATAYALRHGLNTGSLGEEATRFP